MLRAEDIKKNIDLVEIVSESVRLKRSGRYLMGLCPFHGERHPSFCVDPERQLFYCFGCGAGGDVFNFVMRLHNYTFHEALSFLAERAGIREVVDERVDFLKGLQVLFQKTLLMSKRAKAYLKRRGIAPDRAGEFGIGLCPKNLLEILRRKNQLLLAERSGLKEKFIGVFQGRLTFPFYDRSGNLVGFAARRINGQGPKYINTEETDLFKKRGLLFGINFLKKRGKVYVVEGYFDCISCLAAGIPAVATGGTSFTADQARLLKGFDRVVVAFDGDKAGRAATMRAFKVLVACDVYPYAIFLPKGEDPDSLVRKGRERFLCLPERDLFELIKDTIGRLPPQSAVERLNNLASFLRDSPSALSKLLLERIKGAFGIKIKRQAKKQLDTETRILEILLSSRELVEDLKEKGLLEAIENPEIREALRYFAEHKMLPPASAYMNLLARATIYPASQDLKEKAIRYLKRKRACKGL